MMPDVSMWGMYVAVDGGVELEELEVDVAVGVVGLVLVKEMEDAAPVITTAAPNEADPVPVGTAA